MLCSEDLPVTPGMAFLIAQRVFVRSLSLLFLPSVSFLITPASRIKWRSKNANIKYRNECTKNNWTSRIANQWGTLKTSIKKPNQAANLLFFYMKSKWATGLSAKARTDKAHLQHKCSSSVAVHSFTVIHMERRFMSTWCKTEAMHFIFVCLSVGHIPKSWVRGDGLPADTCSAYTLPWFPDLVLFHSFVKR